MRPILIDAIDDEYKVKGIVTSKYMINSNVMKSGDEFEENALFFQGYSGMVNRTADSGIPLYVSKPHYFEVEDAVALSVDGLTADATQHDTSLYVVLMLGSTIKASEKLMYSVGFDYDTSTLSKCENITSGQMFPMFWVDRDIELTDDQADTLKALLDLIALAILLCIVLGTGIGGFFIMVGSCCLLAHKRAGSRAKIIPVDSEMDTKAK